jgi:type I restriction enzyme R subunit
MKKIISEQQVEQASLDWFEALGFTIRRGVELSPKADMPLRDSYEQVVLTPRLRAALHTINAHLPDDAIEQAVRVVLRPPEPTLAQNNRWFHRLLTGGVDVAYRTEDGETRGDKAWLVDFDQPACNEGWVVNQFTVQRGNRMRRPDLVVFINGLPLVVVELKDPADEQADLWTAYRQLQGYQEDIPALLTYNALLAISDGDRTRVGSLTAGSDRFAPWRAIDDARAPGEPTLEALIKGLFDPIHWFDYLRYCITFAEDDRSGAIVKKIAAYHQFRAVLAARATIKAALKPPLAKATGAAA